MWAWNLICPSPDPNPNPSWCMIGWFVCRERCVSMRISWSRCVSTHQRPLWWPTAPTLMTRGDRKGKLKRREERSHPKTQRAWGWAWGGVCEWASVTPFSESITCSEWPYWFTLFSYLCCYTLLSCCRSVMQLWMKYYNLTVEFKMVLINHILCLYPDNLAFFFFHGRGLPHVVTVA